MAITQVTIAVGNPDERLAAVAAAAGGAVVAPTTSITGAGWYATRAESRGLVFAPVPARPPGATADARAWRRTMRARRWPAMSTGALTDTWEHGSPYERYIGRWSRRIAPLFVSWLDAPAGRRWLDVGCGTGALCAAVLDRCAPRQLTGVEPSEGFRRLAARHLGSRAVVLAGDAAALPLDDGSCDVVVSGLVLNFVPDLPRALAEMARVAVPGGTIAAYVWDYADRMEIIKSFWDAAVSLDPTAAQLDEALRFPVCRPAALKDAFERAGLSAVETTSLEVAAEFVDFEDYWQPFLGGQGPAPAYAMSLSEQKRAALRDRLQAALPADGRGPFSLSARAWAVRGTTSGDARGIT